MKVVWFVFWIVVTVVVSWMTAWSPAYSAPTEAGASRQIRLPETEAAKRVKRYFLAFNTGDTLAMRTFLVKNFTATALEQRPLDVRLEVYRQLYDEHRGLQIRRVEQVTDSSIAVTVSTQTSTWLRMTFAHEMVAPQKLVWIRIDIVDAPAELAGPPLTQAEALAMVGKQVDSVAREGRFSGAVLVAFGDTPVFSKAVGYASIEHQVPNRVDTKFNLGSINKIFTKTAIAQLVQQGKVRLDATLGTYLPDYPNKVAREKVTIQQLIEMRSGIGDFFGEKFDRTPKDRLRTNHSFLPLFAEDSLHFEPGSQREYSNGGYIVLGAIIERVSGEDYYAYVREHIFTPAGMTNTESYEADAIVPNLAMGYTYADERGNVGSRLHQNIYTRPARASAAGGGYSTAEDLLKFAVALREGKLLDKRYTVWMFTDNLPEAEPTDLGAALATARLDVAGGSLGINAELSVNNETGYTVVTMGNYDPPSAQDMNRAIREIVARVQAAGRG